MLRHVRKGHLKRQRDLKNGRERNAADKSRVGDARDRASNTDSCRDSIVGLLCRCEAFFFADVCGCDIHARYFPNQVEEKSKTNQGRDGHRDHQRERLRAWLTRRAGREVAFIAASTAFPCGACLTFAVEAPSPCQRIEVLELDTFVTKGQVAAS